MSGVRRSLRRIVLCTFCAAAMAVAGPVTPVRAQLPPVLPPLPPPPEQAEPVLEILAPVANPACANAFLVAFLLQASADAPVDPLTVVGPAFVVCGSIPRDGEMLTCLGDDAIADAVKEIQMTALGAALPFDVRVTGPLVEMVVRVEDRLPPPANTHALSELAVGTLQCHPVGAATPDGELPPTSAGGGPSGPPLALGPVPVPAPLPPAIAPPQIPGPVPSAIRGPSGFAGLFRYPWVFLVPLAMLAGAVFLLRLFTSDPLPLQWHSSQVRGV